MLGSVEGRGRVAAVVNIGPRLEPEHLVRRRGSSGSERRCSGGQAEVQQDALDHLGIGDEGDHLMRSAAAAARQEVDGEGPAQELGPSQVALALGPRRRVAEAVHWWGPQDI